MKRPAKKKAGGERNPHLVNCPFCGNVPHMTNRSYAWWKVKCTCGVMTFECHTEERARTIWNSRTAKAALNYHRPLPIITE